MRQKPPHHELAPITPERHPTIGQLNPICQPAGAYLDARTSPLESLSPSSSSSSSLPAGIHQAPSSLWLSRLCKRSIRLILPMVPQIKSGTTSKPIPPLCSAAPVPAVPLAPREPRPIQPMLPPANHLHTAASTHSQKTAGGLRHNHQPPPPRGLRLGKPSSRRSASPSTRWVETKPLLYGSINHFIMRLMRD